MVLFDRFAARRCKLSLHLRDYVYWSALLREVFEFRLNYSNTRGHICEVFISLQNMKL